MYCSGSRFARRRSRDRQAERQRPRTAALERVREEARADALEGFRERADRLPLEQGERETLEDQHAGQGHDERGDAPIGDPVALGRTDQSADDQGQRGGEAGLVVPRRLGWTDVVRASTAAASGVAAASSGGLSRADVGELIELTSGKPATAVEGGPEVILVVGVNGTGKTTTVGKLARVLVADEVASGFGRTGPYRDRPGFARVAEAFAGLTHITGMPDGPPMFAGYAVGQGTALVPSPDAGPVG